MNGDMNHLDKLLDVIDSKKMKVGSIDVQNAQNLIDPLEIYAWKKYFNPESNKYYYYNHKTNVSQWDKPDNFIENPHPHSSDIISHQAVFNYNDSNFSLSGNKSYWEAVGRPNDREGYIFNIPPLVIIYLFIYLFIIWIYSFSLLQEDSCLHFLI